MDFLKCQKKIPLQNGKLQMAPSNFEYATVQHRNNAVELVVFVTIGGFGTFPVIQDSVKIEDGVVGVYQQASVKKQMEQEKVKLEQTVKEALLGATNLYSTISTGQYVH